MNCCQMLVGDLQKRRPADVGVTEVYLRYALGYDVVLSEASGVLLAPTALLADGVRRLIPAHRISRNLVCCTGISYGVKM